jgi:8-oxo-dGTP diphosphatase
MIYADGKLRILQMQRIEPGLWRPRHALWLFASDFPSFRRPFNTAIATMHPFRCVYTRDVEETHASSNNRPSGAALRFVVAALIVRGGEILIGQLRPDQPMALQWEFPGGKIEPGESPELALARELEEELGIQAAIGPLVTRIRHNYRHGGAVDLQFFAVREYSGEIVNRIFHQLRWVRLEDLPTYDFLAADRPVIRDLAAGKLL